MKTAQEMAQVLLDGCFLTNNREASLSDVANALAEMLKDYKEAIQKRDYACARMHEALVRLSKLGNEPEVGNSIALEALSHNPWSQAFSMSRPAIMPDLGRRGDWTESEGRSNSSDQFLKLVSEVDRLIKDSAHSLVCGRSRDVAGCIMAQLAHKHHLAPS